MVVDLDVRLKWSGASLVGEDPTGMWRSGCRESVVCVCVCKGKTLSSAKGGPRVGAWVLMNRADQISDTKQRSKSKKPGTGQREKGDAQPVKNVSQIRDQVNQDEPLAGVEVSTLQSDCQKRLCYFREGTFPVFAKIASSMLSFLNSRGPLTC